MKNGTLPKPDYKPHGIERVNEWVDRLTYREIIQINTIALITLFIILIMITDENSVKISLEIKERLYADEKQINAFIKENDRQLLSLCNQIQGCKTEMKQ